MLTASGIRKSFSGVVAIESAHLSLQAGEIHALVGANGAGKSTLVRILTGAIHPDAGEIELAGCPVHFRSPQDAYRAGVATIFQEFSLVPTLSVRANLFLGQEPGRYGVLDPVVEKRLAHQTLDLIGLSVDAEAQVRNLSVAQQQQVEIARALIRESRILILDEPTASLSQREVQRLFDILRGLAASGIAILFISHRLEEVLALSSRVTVMRDGETLPTRPISNVTKAELIEQMVGRRMDDEFPVRTHQRSEPVFEIRGMSGRGVKCTSFTVRRGEILGLAGLVGAGRTELARLIFGADRRAEGEIIMEGEVCRVTSPHDAVRAGICLLTEDRKAQGLVLKAPARENFALPNLSLWSRHGWIQSNREMVRFRSRAAELALRMASPEQPADTLSGGNQQKLLIARWIETHCRVFIFDEPTRGIDVGAKRDIYVLIDRLAAAGKAIIVISSEFPELLGICDRILVMRAGEITGEIEDVTAASPESIMALAV